MKTVKSLVLVILGFIILCGLTINTYATNEMLVKDTGYIEANVKVPEGFDTTITINLLMEDGKDYSVKLEAKNKYKTNEKIPVGEYSTDDINIDNENKYIIECSAGIVIEKDKKTAYAITIKDRNLEQEQKSNTSAREDSDSLRKSWEDTSKIDTPDTEYFNEQESVIEPETNLELTAQEEEKSKENSITQDNKQSESAMTRVGNFGYKLLEKNKINLIMIGLFTIILVVIKTKKKYF